MMKKNKPEMSAPAKTEKSDSKMKAGGTASMDKSAPGGMANSKTKSSATTKSATTKSDSNTKSSTTVGSTSDSVQLTTQQRAMIREKVLVSGAPRVENVNFSINVGTVIPSSVRIVAVPPTLIQIHPRWRGYRYFVVNDQIVIVEPKTLKIVAVLAV